MITFWWCSRFPESLTFDHKATYSATPVILEIVKFYTFGGKRSEWTLIIQFLPKGMFLRGLFPNHPPDSLPDQRLQVSARWQLTQEFAVAAGEQTICVPRRSAERHKTSAIKPEARKRQRRRGRTGDARTGSCKLINWLLITVMTGVWFNFGASGTCIL